MFIYILLLFQTIICFTFIKNKKVALIISFIFITILACARSYTVGVDTDQFYRMYTKIGEDSSWNYRNFRYELGFYYFCKILYNIWSNPQFLIIASSLIINYSVYRFIKNNSKNFFLSVFLYITMNIFFSYMNVMRQALAVSIILYGFNYMIERKNFRFIFVILLASLFHNVAWAMLLIPIYSLLPRKRFVFILSSFVAIVLFFKYDMLFSFLTSIFGYSHYANTSFGESNYFGALLNFLEVLCIFLMCYFIARQYNKKVIFEDEKIFLLMCTTIIYITFMLLIMRMNIFNRVSGIYSIYLIITLPELLNLIKNKSKRSYYFTTGIVIMVYVFSFFVISYLRPEWMGCVPYAFCI